MNRLACFGAALVAATIAYSQPPPILAPDLASQARLLSGLDHVAIAGDGGFIVAGSSSSGPSGTKTNEAFGGKDFWLVRADATGALLWQRGYGGSGDDTLLSFQQTAEGGFILAGTSSSAPSGNKTSPHFGGLDFWVVRLDPEGNKLWESSLGGAGEDTLLSVRQTGEGGFLVAGTSTSGADGNKSSPARGQEDFWAVRLDPQGVKIWDQSFGGSANDRLGAASQIGDGGFLLAGTSSSGADGNKTSPNRGADDFWVVRLDAVGDRLWEGSFGGAAAEGLLVGAQIADGGFVLGGFSRSGMTGNKSSAGFGAEDFWLVRLDPFGTPLWDQSFGGSNLDVLNGVAQTGDAGFLLSGYSASGMSGNKTNAGFGGLDFWIIRLDPFGQRLWEQALGGTGDDLLVDVAQTELGDLNLCGISSSGLTGNKQTEGFGNYDFWVVRLDGIGSKLLELSVGGAGCDVFRAVELTAAGGLVLAGDTDSAISGNKTTPSFGNGDIWVVSVTPEGSPARDVTLGGNQADALVGLGQPGTAGALVLAAASRRTDLALTLRPSAQFPPEVDGTANYVVEFSTDLRVWRPMRTNHTANFEMLERPALNSPRGFYRVRRAP